MTKLYKLVAINAILIILVISIFDGILFQIQAKFLGDYIVRPSLLRYVLVILLLPAFLKSRANSFFVLSAIILVSLIVINMILTGENYAEGFNLYYGLLLTLLILVVLINSNLPIQHITTILVGMLYLSLILGVIQWFGLIKLPTSIIGEPSFIQSSQIYGIDRVFSVFSSGLNFGYASLAALLISSTVKSIPKKILLMSLCIFCVYISYTRTIYILAAISLAIMMLNPVIKKMPDSLRKAMQIVVMPGAAFYLIYFASKLPKTRDFLSSESSHLRINSWRNILNEVSDGGFLAWMFGTGLYQGYQNMYIIDNMYIAVIHNIGIIGMIGWGAYMSFLIYELRKNVGKNLLYVFEGFVLIMVFAMVYNLSVGFNEALIVLITMFLISRGVKNEKV